MINILFNKRGSIMGKEKLNVGEISKPRFEFRSFGQDFNKQAERMARLSISIPEKLRVRHSPETYITVSYTHLTLPTKA